MGFVTAKQLKQKTGEVIKRIQAGERLTLTYRGKPLAVIEPAPARNDVDSGKVRPLDEAWKDIEEAMKNSEPVFKDWREATKWVRGRT